MRTADGLLVLPPGEGDGFSSMGVVRKSSARDGDGRWGVVVVTAEPTDGARTHVHRGAAEAFFLLEGRVELLGAESVTPLTPGAFVLVPPDTEHGLRVLGDAAASWLAIWPAEMDGLPEALDALPEDARRTRSVDVGRAHGIEPGRRRAT